MLQHHFVASRHQDQRRKWRTRWQFRFSWVHLYPCQPRHSHWHSGLCSDIRMKRDGTEGNANCQSWVIEIWLTSFFCRISLHPHIYFENFTKLAWNFVLDVGFFLSALFFFFFWLAATLIDITEEKWRKCFFFFLQVIHSPPPFNCQIWQVANRAAPLPALSQLRNTHYCKISMIRNWSVYKHQVYFSQTVEVKGTPVFFHSGLLHKRGIKLFCPTGWEPVLKDT